MKYRLWIKALLFFLLSAAFTLALACLLGAIDAHPNKNTSEIPTSGTQLPRYTTVIIDAGHGGEDGGATSAAGLVEKDVNLEISQMLCDMLRTNGINVIMTREDDRLLYDRNTNYQGRKKKLDLAARLAIADSTTDAIFVSIHMNSFSQEKYSGLQVYFSENSPLSQNLAENIQELVKNNLQPNNTRTIKPSGGNIFLLDKIQHPAVLVECGFLSNSEECELLCTPEYRKRLSMVIFCSVASYLENFENMGNNPANST